jgi:hypothetical protein
MLQLTAQAFPHGSWQSSQGMNCILQNLPRHRLVTAILSFYPNPTSQLRQNSQAGAASDKKEEENLAYFLVEKLQLLC